MKLGVEDIIKISATRQVYGCAQARYETKHLSGDLRDIFGLEKPVEEASVSSADAEESTIKILEDQVATVQAEFAAFPTPAQTLCEWFGHEPPNVTCASRGCHPSINNTCASCLTGRESDERRLKREDKEDKERCLKDLKEKRDVKQRDLAEKQERMALFR